MEKQGGNFVDLSSGEIKSDEGLKCGTLRGKNGVNVLGINVQGRRGLSHK